MVRDSDYCRASLKRRILSNDIIPYVCAKCGNTGEWNGEKLSLQLDHKNGISNDNRIENLRFLCPNCHSQTDSFAGKRFKKKYVCKSCGGEKKTKINDLCTTCSAKESRKVDWDNVDLLKMKKTMNNSEIGRKLGVSESAIRKRLKIIAL